MAKPGRPRTSRLSRAEQLLAAKRRQRARQRAAGFVNVQLTIPKRLAEKIAVARRTGALEAALDEALNRAIVRIEDYPQLKDLAWNRADEFLSAREAFELYERNWRLIDAKRLAPAERRLIDRLKHDFGAGVINA